jgi:hypothetical protein
MRNLRNTKLSTVNTINTTYAGEFAGNYIAAAILSANTIANNGVTVRPNIKFKEVVKTLTSTNIIQDATCDFDDSGVVTLSEKVLTVQEKQVNLQLCKTPFQSDWDAVQMGYSAFDVMPSSFSDFFIGKILKDVALNTENFLWNATNGFPKLLVDDGAIKETSVAIDSTNVLDKMKAVVAKLPQALYGREDLRLFVSQKVAKAYISALGGFGASGLGSNGFANQGTTWYTNGTALTFEGIQIFVANGLNAVDSGNSMVLTTIENLYFGTGLMDDYNLVKTIDMQDIDGSKNVRFIMRWTQGLQVGFGADSVVFSSL